MGFGFGDLLPWNAPKAGGKILGKNSDQSFMQQTFNPFGFEMLGGPGAQAPERGGLPTPPAYVPGYDSEKAMHDLGNNDFLNKMNSEAMRTGPSKSANLMNLEADRQGLIARDNNAQTASGSAAKARSDLAARGGLSSGARERVEMNATNDVMNLNQKTNQAVMGNRAQIGINDEQNRIGQLQTAGQMKNSTNMFDITSKANETAQRNAYNQNLYNQQMQIEAANRTADAQVAASNGPSSFICTALREAGLMSPRETLAMTEFMLASVIDRGDFFAWYFGTGKEAIEVAKQQKFDFSLIKKQYVDEIRTVLEKEGLEAAQSLYIERAGQFCVQFLGADCGYKHSMAQPGLFKGVLGLPRVFTRLQTYRWLKAYLGAKIDRSMTKMYRKWRLV